jgi:hypothetical protein
MDPDPSIFTDLQDANKKLTFKKSFPVYYFLRYLYIIFKEKVKKMPQNSRNQGFSYYVYLLNDRRIRIREAQKHVDPMDPDPEHCKKYIKNHSFLR